jgi:hypothetical protein
MSNLAMINAAHDDAEKYGTGWLMVLPGHIFRHVPPEMLAVHVIRGQAPEILAVHWDWPRKAVEGDI